MGRQSAICAIMQNWKDPLWKFHNAERRGKWCYHYHMLYRLLHHGRASLWWAMLMFLSCACKRLQFQVLGGSRTNLNIVSGPLLGQCICVLGVGETMLVHADRFNQHYTLCSFIRGQSQTSVSKQTVEHNMVHTDWLQVPMSMMWQIDACMHLRALEKQSVHALGVG